VKTHVYRLLPPRPKMRHPGRSWIGLAKRAREHGCTAARGMTGCVITPLRVATWRLCSGRGSATARGMSGRAHFAAQGGHLDVLMWAWERGCPWHLMDEQGHLDEDLDCCALAARNGHLAVLQWAREHDCPWNEMTSSGAAAGGHLEVLRWARERDCPWDERNVFRRRCGRAPYGAEVGAGTRLSVGSGDVCIAATCGRPQCYSVTVGVGERLPVGRGDVQWAARAGRLGALKWAVARGCTCNATRCEDAADERGFVEVARWVRGYTAFQ